MNENQLKVEYDREGYVVVRKFLSPTEFAELQQNLDRYIREIVPGLPGTDAFYDDPSRPETLRQMHRMSQDAWFEAYRNHPKWKQLAELQIGEKCLALEPEWFNKPPLSTKGTPAHQDNFYFCLKPCHVLTIWMALDVVDDENACVRCVPGSHLEPTRPHARGGVLGFSQQIGDYGPDDVAREVPIHLQPGDVMVHHGNTIHLANANRSATRHRRAFAMVFKGISCQRDEEAFAIYQASAKAQRSELLATPS
jgi:phytanoyl-CoA hydroxylase